MFWLLWFNLLTPISFSRDWCFIIIFIAIIYFRMICFLFYFGFRALAFIFFYQYRFFYASLCKWQTLLMHLQCMLDFLNACFERKIVWYSTCFRIQINFITISQLNFIFFIKITFFDVWMSAILLWQSFDNSYVFEIFHRPIFHVQVNTYFRFRWEGTRILCKCCPAAYFTGIISFSSDKGSY